MNARQKLANLHRRDNRLQSVKWLPGTGANRRVVIERVQRRLWGEMRILAPEASMERQLEDWPNGLPAHP